MKLPKTPIESFILLGSWLIIFTGAANVVVGILKFSEVIAPVIEDSGNFTTDPVVMIGVGFAITLFGLLLRRKTQERIREKLK